MIPKPAVLALVAALPLASGDAGLVGQYADELELAAGYAAKEACSCAFVEGQTDAYCTAYGVSPTGVTTMTLVIDHAASTVTATYAGDTRTATFAAGAGCTLGGL